MTQVPQYMTVYWHHEGLHHHGLVWQFSIGSACAHVHSPEYSLCSNATVLHVQRLMLFTINEIMELHSLGRSSQVTVTWLHNAGGWYMARLLDCGCC